MQYTERQLPLSVFTVLETNCELINLHLIFIFLMSTETYQEIKRLSGEELRELLSDLDNVFDLGTVTLMDDSFLISSDY